MAVRKTSRRKRARIARKRNGTNGPGLRKGPGRQSPFASASAFVRSQPMDIPAKEVVEAGSRLGISVTPNLVRIVRFKMRQAGQAPPLSKGRPGRRARTGAAARNQPQGGVETQFRRLVLELGTSRANELMTAVERAIQGIIGRS